MGLDEIRLFSVAILAQDFKISSSRYPAVPMSKARPRENGPNSPDAKHHKPEENQILEEIRSLRKDMATKQDLESMCAGLVSKADFDTFKKEQAENLKKEVKEEVQRQLQHVTAQNDAFMDYIHQRMIDDVKLKAKLDGFPKAWAEKDLWDSPELQQILQNCSGIDMFKTKSGENMGKAMLTFKSVKDRQAAVSKSKELRIKVEDRNVFLNNAETELDLKKNKALRQAFAEVKSQWEGDKRDVKVFKKEGQIKIRGEVVAERDETSWCVVWKKPKSGLKSEADLAAMSG